MVVGLVDGFGSLFGVGLVEVYYFGVARAAVGCGL